MSAAPMVSERAAVLRERKAFRAGFTAAFAKAAQFMDQGDANYAAYEEVARYPLPMVERPRVEKDPHESFEWTIVGRSLHVRRIANSTHVDLNAGVFGFHPTPERVALWADLLANPMVSLPDDGGREDGV